STTCTRSTSLSGRWESTAACMADRPLAPALRPFEAVGGRTISVVDSLGRFGTFFVDALVAIVTPPFKLRAFIDRINYIGFRSLLIILLTGAFTGMVLGLQVYLTLVRFGSEAFLGPAVALSLIRELGPVLAALMVTGRAGSALTAEIGIMRITEQIDALTVMALNPMRHVGLHLQGLQRRPRRRGRRAGDDPGGCPLVGADPRLGLLHGLDPPLMIVVVRAAAAGEASR